MKKIEAQQELELLAGLRKDSQEAIRLRGRHDFLTFAQLVTEGQFKPFAVHRLLCSTLNGVARGETQKLQISIAPRSGKSFLTSQLFPAYILGRNPSSQNMLASYGKNLMREHAMRTLDIMTSARYKWLFPELELRSKEIAETIRTKQGGVSRITSAGASATGFGYGYLENDCFPGIAIMDDLIADGNSAQIMNSTWDWTTQQFLTRKLPNYAILSVGTRFAKNDITGRLIEAQPDEWQILNVPALCIDEENDLLGRKLGESHWKEYFPAEQLESTRKQIGERNFQALYQGNPISAESAIFRVSMFSYYTEQPYFRYKYATIDSAFSTKETADESVIGIFGVDLQNQLYLINMIRGRFDFPTLVQQTKTAVETYSLNEVCIEAKASGQSLIQVLEKEIHTKITPLKANQDKVTRANAAVPAISAGSLWVPNASWWHESGGVLEQMVDFPNVAHDDAVDVIVHAVLHYIANFQQRANTSFQFTSIGSTRLIGGGRGNYRW